MMRSKISRIAVGYGGSILIITRFGILCHPRRPMRLPVARRTHSSKNGSKAYVGWFAKSGDEPLWEGVAGARMVLLPWWNRPICRPSWNGSLLGGSGWVGGESEPRRSSKGSCCCAGIVRGAVAANWYVQRSPLLATVLLMTMMLSRHFLSMSILHACLSRTDYSRSLDDLHLPPPTLSWRGVGRGVHLTWIRKGTRLEKRGM